jgi:hypothetical protein
MGVFDWFRSKPECPIDRVRQAPVVLPRPEFFPDPFHGKEEDVRRMLDRVCGYMDIDPKTILMSLYSDQSPRFRLFSRTSW